MHPCRLHRIGILYLRLSLGLPDEVTYDVLVDSALVVLSMEVRANAHAEFATSVTRVLPTKYDTRDHTDVLPLLASKFEAVVDAAYQDLITNIAFGSDVEEGKFGESSNRSWSASWLVSALTSTLSYNALLPLMNYKKCSHSWSLRLLTPHSITSLIQWLRRVLSALSKLPLSSRLSTICRLVFV